MASQVREPAYFRDRPRIGIGAEYLVALPKQVHQIAASPASRVDYTHATPYAALQQLVEQINIDRAELFCEKCHWI